MDTGPLANAVRRRLPSDWSVASLMVSRNDGVMLCHPETQASVAPGAEVLRLAQELLDGKLGGRPYELEMRREGNIWKAELLPDDQAEPALAWSEEAIRTWELISAERQAVYEEHFGGGFDEVHKVPTLVGMWPGGGMVQLPYDDDITLTASWGLSNYGLPTPVGVYEGFDDDGQPMAELGSRPRRLVASGSAGYGYEFLMLTPAAEDWPLVAMARLLEKEFLEDTDFLGKVHQYGSVSVEGLPLSADWVVHALITLAVDPLPESVTLSNGLCQFLVVTIISGEELDFAMRRGRDALARRMDEDGVSQFSDLEIESDPGP